ncbi:MAG: hypothetical protein M0R17_00135 [Candidatus Omnitrophica bacterium]|jgi:hypothetical protein|nr:hypothetical protein [Candidatus Omnitrophota bacterium]
MKNWMLGIFAILAVVFGILFFTNRSTKHVDLGSIDSSKSKIETLYVHNTDTLYKLGQNKLRIDTAYVLDSIYLTKLATDTSKEKKVFDSIFPINKLDGTSTNVGYSQITKTIELNNKFVRDSSKLSITNVQLGICTTTVSNMVKLSDSALDASKIVVKSAYDSGYSNGAIISKKNTILGGVILFLSGYLIGHIF